MNWGRSFMVGVALAAIGTIAALAMTELRPSAKSEAPRAAVDGAPNGVVPAPPGGVPLVKAEPGPIKVKPKDPGGLVIPHKDKSIYERLESQRKVMPAGDAGKGGKSPAAKPGQKKVAQAIGPYRVQLGAFDSSESAQRRWQELKSRHGDLVGGLSMVLERVELKAKGTMYRLQAGPLKSPEDVQKLCAALAKRKVACFLVKS